MLFFSSRGYPCYAVSYRGHGGSWYPGFWKMYFTSRGCIAEDLVAGIKEVERLEGERRKVAEKISAKQRVVEGPGLLYVCCGTRIRIVSPSLR